MALPSPSPSMSRDLVAEIKAKTDARISAESQKRLLLTTAPAVSLQYDDDKELVSSCQNWSLLRSIDDTSSVGDNSVPPVVATTVQSLAPTHLIINNDAEPKLINAVNSSPTVNKIRTASICSLGPLLAFFPPHIIKSMYESKPRAVESFDLKHSVVVHELEKQIHSLTERAIQAETQLSEIQKQEVRSPAIKPLNTGESQLRPLRKKYLEAHESVVTAREMHCASDRLLDARRKEISKLEIDLQRCLSSVSGDGNGEGLLAETLKRREALQEAQLRFERAGNRVVNNSKQLETCEQNLKTVINEIQSLGYDVNAVMTGDYDSSHADEHSRLAQLYAKLQSDLELKEIESQRLRANMDLLYNKYCASESKVKEYALKVRDYAEAEQQRLSEGVQRRDKDRRIYMDSSVALDKLQEMEHVSTANGVAMSIISELKEMLQCIQQSVWPSQSLGSPLPTLSMSMSSQPTPVALEWEREFMKK